MPFTIQYKNKQLTTAEVAKKVVALSEDPSTISKNIDDVLMNIAGVAIKKELIKNCTEELKKKKVSKEAIKSIISQTIYGEALNNVTIATLIKKLRKQAGINASNAFPQTPDRLATSLTLFELANKDKAHFKKSIKTADKIRSLLPKSSSEAPDFHNSSNPVDGHYNDYLDDAEHFTKYHTHLQSLQLDHNSVTKYPAFAPYLGRFTAEAPVSWMRKIKTALITASSRIHVYKEPKPKNEEIAHIDRGYKAAKQFCDEHKYDSEAKCYGGDSPFELSAAIGPTLAKAEDLNFTTRFELVSGDTVENARAMHTGLANEDARKMGIVNCANKDRVGGVWETKKGSQEEALARSSNLINALNAFKSLRRGKKNHIPANGAAYTPAVTIRHENGDFDCDVSSIAAVNWRRISSERRAIVSAAKKLKMNPEEYLKQVTKNKYAALFGSFLENGVTDVLISLPGLGSFKNKPEMVGEILKELFINDGAPFKGKFQTVKINIFDPEKETASTDMVNQFIASSKVQNEEL